MSIVNIELEVADSDLEKIYLEVADTKSVADKMFNVGTVVSVYTDSIEDELYCEDPDTFI